MSEFGEFFKVKFPNIQATIDQTHSEESILLKKACRMVWNDRQKEIDQLKAEKEGLKKAIDNEIKRCLDSIDAPIRDEHDKGWCNAMLSAVSSFKRLRGEHE